MNTKLLVSLGSTLAATKLAQTISHLEADDVLRVVGLSKRRSFFFENIALLGIGALAGAGAALLLAPASGQETRDRLNSELNRVKDATVDALRDAKQRAPALLNQVRENAKHENTYNT